MGIGVDCVRMFVPSTSPAVFADRRTRLDRLFAGPKVFASGFARPRNFPGNPYPFRAESHFLYFAGARLEGALLAMSAGQSVLYADPPHEDDALWFGPSRGLAALEKRLEITVRPLDEFRASPDYATLPPQDATTANWLGSFLGRGIEEGTGDELQGIDAALADAVIAVRLRHDDAAIEQLRFAAKVTEAAHRAGMSSTRAGDKESVVRAAMESAIVAHDL